MPQPVRVTPKAAEEARAAFRWYFERNPAVANRFEAELGKALESLAETPEGGAVLEPGIRRLLVPRFPYGVLYALEPSIIVVLAVMHLRRRPGYWRHQR